MHTATCQGSTSACSQQCQVLTAMLRLAVAGSRQPSPSLHAECSRGMLELLTPWLGESPRESLGERLEETSRESDECCIEGCRRRTGADTGCGSQGTSGRDAIWTRCGVRASRYRISSRPPLDEIGHDCLDLAPLDLSASSSEGSLQPVRSPVEDLDRRIAACDSRGRRGEGVGGGQLY